MIIADVNVLVAAYIAKHPFHLRARALVRSALETGGLAVPDVVWSGLVRTVTNPAVVNPPATWAQVRDFVTTIRQHPGYRTEVRCMMSPLESFLALCHATDAKRNRVSDAYIAAIAIDYNSPVATWDTDFKAFPISTIRPTLAGDD